MRLHKGQIFNAQVAAKVKEIRKTGILDGDKTFQNLILQLAKRGFITI